MKYITLINTDFVVYFNVSNHFSSKQNLLILSQKITGKIFSLVLQLLIKGIKIQVKKWLVILVYNIPEFTVLIRCL